MGKRRLDHMVTGTSSDEHGGGGAVRCTVAAAKRGREGAGRGLGDAQAHPRGDGEDGEARGGRAAQW